MKVTIFGAGYVGLVTGACFAEVGNTVICIDSDEIKVSKLLQGIVPIWEPGLDAMIENNVKSGRLFFTTDVELAVNSSDIIFIAVGTPPGEDGSADLQYVLEVAKSIATYMKDEKTIVDKSTVPVGTADKVNSVIRDVLDQRKANIAFSVVSNPEFLREGVAINDFMKPDRIIIGVDNPKAENTMLALYKPFNLLSDRVISMDIRSAEMTKYAANAMLATKISFINEISLLCDKYGADVSQVREGIGSDSRIGYHFIYPGIGYGGSCFPKDVKALIHMAETAGVTPLILNAVEERNFEQKRVLVDRVIEKYGNDLEGLVFALWGLSFKPQTDDMREAPSVIIINELLKRGASIQAYDPVAMKEAKKLFSNPRLSFVDEQYAACNNADGLLLLTEWMQFRSPDFVKIKSKMRQAVVFDGRNQYKPGMMRNLGFDYYSIGRP